MSTSQIQAGCIVWASYENLGEFRFRVLEVNGAVAVLKGPGSDSGSFVRGLDECYLSNGTPSTIEEIYKAD